MATVDRATVLDAPADAVWAAVRTPAAFRTVTRGLLTMPVLRRRTRPWSEGEIVIGWVLLFRCIPFSRHHLHIARIDDTTMTLCSHEHGGLVRRWDHDIVVTPVDDHRCRYRDRVEIDAGVLTPLVVAFARWFYGVRQRRWQVLADGLR